MESLPLNIFLYIQYFLDLKSINRISCTCKKFYNILTSKTKSNLLWKKKIDSIGFIYGTELEYRKLNAKKEEEDWRSVLKDIHPRKIYAMKENGLIEEKRMNMNMVIESFGLMSRNNMMFFLTADGSLWTYSPFEDTELSDKRLFGEDFNERNIQSPIKFVQHKVKKFQVVWESYAFITTDGSAYTLGTNSMGELGDPDTTNSGHFTPYRVPAFLDRKMIDVSFHMCFMIWLEDNGDTWVCGTIFGNSNIGIKDVSQTSAPLRTNSHLLGKGIKVSTCFHTLILTDDNKVIAFGSNLNGKTGIFEDITMIEEPTLVEIPSYVGKIVDLFALSSSSVFINEDGELYYTMDEKFNKLKIDGKITNYSNNKDFFYVQANRREWYEIDLKSFKLTLLDLPYDQFCIEDICVIQYDDDIEEKTKKYVVAKHLD